MANHGELSATGTACGLFFTVVAASLTGCSGPGDGNALAGEDLPVLVTTKERQDQFVSNLVRGRLQIDGNGCVRLDGIFVVWQAGSRLSRSPDNGIELLDGATGKVVRVGEEIGTSGVASDTPPDPERLAVPIPAACAVGPFMIGGPVTTEAELQGMDRDRANRAPVPSPPEPANPPKRSGE